MRTKIIYFLLFSLIFIFSCKKDTKKINETPQSEPTPTTNIYLPIVPQGWPAPSYMFQNNPVTYDGFTLGRYLFYEPLLSLDTTVACGSCHEQTFAFSNGPSHTFSHGVNDVIGKRNSLALFNLTWPNQLMWDGAVNNLENQAITPITNPVEMNLNLGTAVSRLSYSTKYKTLFKKAFGDTLINSQRMLRAFAQFMGLMVSNNSKYDKVKAGQDVFTLSENNGYAVFTTNCAGCHTEPLFSDYTFRNKGLPINAYQDSGRYNITQNTADIYKFKVPTLRNLGFTAPYMHDGRFQTLSEVIDFFTNGVANTQNLDPFMVTPHPITIQQKSDLISFLNTLNDYSFTTNPRFSEIH